MLDIYRQDTETNGYDLQQWHLGQEIEQLRRGRVPRLVLAGNEAIFFKAGNLTTKKSEKPAPEEAGFLLRVDWRERRYANPGCRALLYQASGHNPVYRPCLLARQLQGSLSWF